MASGDRLQIVLAADDEISGKIRTVRTNIKALTGEMKDYAKQAEDGNADAAKSHERVRQEIIKQKVELTRLAAERTENTREARRLAEEERRLAAAAETATRKQRTGLLRVTDAARGVVRAYDRVAGSMGGTRRASERLETSLNKLDDGADNFQRRWTNAIATVERKMAGFRPKTPGAGATGTTAAAAGGGGSMLMTGGKTLARTGVGAAVAGVGLLTGGALAKGVQVSRDREQMALSLEQLLGDAQKAADTMEWIKQQSAQTPFEMTGLALSTQQLLGFGFGLKETKKNLLTIGDAAAATGKGQEGVDALTRALGQMQAKQKITGEEMMQLTEAGIPGWQLLADEMNMTVGELMEMSSSKGGGKALFDSGAMDKLFKGMSDKYGGLMEKQSDTFAGAQSNLMDTVGNVMADGLEQNGVMDFLTEAMQFLAEKLPLAFEQIQPLIQDFVGYWREAGPVIRPLLIGIGGIIVKVVIPAARLMLKVMTGVMRFLQAAAAKVANAWNGLGDTFRSLKDKFMSILKGIESGFTAWSEVIRNTINTVIGWINKIPGIELDLINAPGADGALWAGGAVNAGTYLVGELGPEMFIPNGGSPFMVGQQGMELRDLPGGVMIPNHLLGSVNVPQSNVTVNVPQQQGGNTINVHGVSDPREAVREIERAQARERRIQRERV